MVARRTTRTSRLYATTNDGYLQAINAKTGQELWSFVPKEMLNRLEPLMLNDET